MWQLWLRMTVMSFFTLCLVLLWLVGPGWCISQEFYIAYSRVCFCVAVVAADGGDELLHALLGAAVAGGAWLVHQRGVLLARPHAHAGARLLLRFTNTHKTTCQEVVVAACIRSCRVTAACMLHAQCTSANVRASCGIV